jgi:hypothetical protein
VLAQACAGVANLALAYGRRWALHASPLGASAGAPGADGLPAWATIRDDNSIPRAFVYDVDVWDDDLTPGGLSPPAVLRAFERARTATLGGPAALSRLQSESIKCLVARMDALAFETHPLTGLPGVTLGQRDVCVLSSTSVRKARICFDQSLVARDAAGPGTRVVLARGLITCLCVDGASGKMCSPPEWITSRFDDVERRR